MARKQVTFTQEQEQEIHEAMKQAKKKQDYRRLLILQTVGTGKKKLEEVALEHGVSKSMVSHLLGDYRKQGIADHWRAAHLADLSVFAKVFHHRHHAGQRERITRLTGEAQ